ncbi:MAG TPA: transferrin receptor-like dimerization domain-containing protein [Terriglobales bacterium]|nr:transferrin receptor-like dimerization domain-containing protein [Terriglobales bacterium]
MFRPAIRLLSIYGLVLAVSASTTGESEAPSKPDSPLRGFSAASSKAERGWEKKFQDGINRDNIRENMRRLSARPHHVGSPYDKDNAQWILARFQEAGFDGRIETFRVLFPTPKERILELLGPTPFRAKLQEPAVPEDATSGQTAEQLPTYNAYSIDGDVTAPLIYVNYGNREDYEQLDRFGISVKGAIVIARYGSGWRGSKPRVAGERGAIGCIIYSDPNDDGYFHGDDYPKGGWRPQEGVQRGSVMDTDYPGDPLTPGVGATADAKRLSIREATTITKIPVLPISYGDALPLLSALQGPIAPEGWRGSLPITYHLGPGPAKVHLKVTSNWDQKPVYDVIATMPGSEASGEWVIRGNHHDAWVNGADDPVSGLSAVLEEARQLGELHKHGWHPRRTILYCAWDGEEPGLLGSTEWVESHRTELQQHAAAYINSDSNGRGFWFASGSHDLEAFINDVARDVNDPETNISVWQRARLRQIAQAPNAEARQEIRERANLRIRSLGSGSDYTAFLDFAGISALNVGFVGENDGNQYHSIYDDFHWYTHFMDTDFSYGRALAQLGGIAVMRMADADLIPFDYRGMADTIARYESDLEKLLKDSQEEAAERNLELSEGVFNAVADPHKPSVPPPPEVPPPYMNFAPLKNGVEAMKRSADRYAAALDRLNQGSLQLSLPQLERVNADLLRIQRAFLTEQGLPQRPWYKHQVYAPGTYNGYGASPIAAIREYMDEKKWKEAEAQVPMVGQVLENVSASIIRAADDLNNATAAKP